MQPRRKSILMWTTALVVLVAAFALFPPDALAQCPLCKAAVPQTGKIARTLNFGIIVLLIPPVAIFCSIFVVALKHRKGRDED